jgi:hypothetical protein
MTNASKGEPAWNQASTGTADDALCPKSAQAVDDLLAFGQLPQHAAEPAAGEPGPPSSQPASAAQRANVRGLVAAKLLRGLECPTLWCCREQMTARTLARIHAARSLEPTALSPELWGDGPLPHASLADSSGSVDLCEDDADALEALVQCGWEAQRVPMALRERASALAGLLGLLSVTPSAMAFGESQPAASGAGLDPAGAAALNQRHVLIKATLVRIADAAPLGALAGAMAGAAGRAHDRSDRLVIRRRDWRVADLAAVAALVAIGGAVLWPTVSAVRERSMQVAGAGRLAGVAQGVDQYASDFRGSLPVASASLAGTRWWNVGTPSQSNSANLFTLRRTGYTSLEQLSSPGNPMAMATPVAPDAWDWPSFEAVSYSYQNQFATVRPCMSARNSRFVILADKSPVVTRALRGERVVYFDENSMNFAGRGQNVLRSDASVQWLTTPFTETGDSLWLPRQIEVLVNCAKRRARGERHCEPLRGIESPDKDDAFLCP